MPGTGNLTPAGQTVPSQATYVQPHTPGISTDAASAAVAAQYAATHPSVPTVRQSALNVCTVVRDGGGKYTPVLTPGKCAIDMAHCDEGESMWFSASDYPEYNCPNMNYCCQYLKGEAAAGEAAAQAAYAAAAAVVQAQQQKQQQQQQQQQAAAAQAAAAAAAAKATPSADMVANAGHLICQFGPEGYPLTTGYCTPDGALCPVDDDFSGSEICDQFGASAQCCAGAAPAAAPASSFIEAKGTSRMQRLHPASKAPGASKAAAAPAHGSPAAKKSAPVKTSAVAARRRQLAALARKGDKAAIAELMRNGPAKPKLSKTRAAAAAAAAKAKGTKSVSPAHAPAPAAKGAKGAAPAKHPRFTQGQLQP